jgi:peptidoglycan/xylan/chitin deacetylase (PgdA/CDA1 family)
MMTGDLSMILCYHSVDPSGSVISVSPSEFGAHMDALAASGRPVVPLTEVCRRPGSVAITFDDGLRSFYQTAFPILQDHRFPATVFVVSGYAGLWNDWTSQPEGIEKFELMTWNEIAEVSRYGIGIGAHTVTHPRLTELAEADARAEMKSCRDQIQDRIGKRAVTFAYPYGDSNAVSRSLAAEFFDFSCGTALDFLNPFSDKADLPRIDTYYVRNEFLFRRLVQGKGGTYIRARRSLRGLRALMAG